MIWKHARDKARIVVSMPAPVRLMASCWRRVRETSSGGRDDSRSALNTVSGCFSVSSTALFWSIVEI